MKLTQRPPSQSLIINGNIKTRFALSFLTLMFKIQSAKRVLMFKTQSAKLDLPVLVN